MVGWSRQPSTERMHTKSIIAIQGTVKARILFLVAVATRISPSYHQ